MLLHENSARQVAPIITEAISNVKQSDAIQDKCDLTLGKVSSILWLTYYFGRL